ncbi:MAG: M14 family metallopeptidase [Planctomycetota bacterium]
MTLTRRLALCLALSIPLAPLAAQVGTQEVRNLVQVRIHDARELDRLLALDLDLASCQGVEPPVKVVELIAKDSDLALLDRAGLDYDVAIRDLASHYEHELARDGGVVTQSLTPPVGSGGMGGNYTLAQMEAILDGFNRDHPALCSAKISIGHSIEGRDIWAVKISDNVALTENEPRAYFDAVHHAREPVSMTLTLAFMDWLLSSYGTDPVATFIVDERELWFVPCVNPDGYEYNRATNPGGGGLWRKNRRNNGDGTFGVDLNRNYATGWSAPNGGNSTATNSDVYRGTAPFSEPETTAIENFMTGRGFVLTCSLHTYQDVLLHPWGWQNGGPANIADYNALGPVLTDDNQIVFGPVSTTLYIAAGGALDHHHAVHGAIAWSPELGRSTEGGFWPAPAQQIAIVNRHLSMVRDMALAAGSVMSIDSASVVEEAGGNGNGAIEAGETGAVTVILRNAGLAALPAGAQVTIQSLTVGVNVLSTNTTVAPLGRLGLAQNGAGTLRIAVAAGFGGSSATVRVTATGGGLTVSRDVDFATRVRRVLVADDMEQDRGFTRGSGTATTGLWERAAPQQTLNGATVIQPGTQHTTGGTLCQVTDARAGTGVGSFDVDGGYTDLLSPVMDLSHVVDAEIDMWYWYAESVGDDAFEIAISSDGGSNWTTLFNSTQSTGAWSELRLPLPAPITDRMRLRFRAQDLNASLVEALVDDFAVRGVAADGAVTVLSSGALGSHARIGFVGEVGAQVIPLVAFASGAPLNIPGIGGSLLLDPASIYAYPSLALPASGHAALELAIPANAALHGAVLHWQGLHAGSQGLALANATTLTLQ